MVMTLIWSKTHEDFIWFNFSRCFCAHLCMFSCLPFPVSPLDPSYCTITSVVSPDICRYYLLLCCMTYAMTPLYLLDWKLRCERTGMIKLTDLLSSVSKLEFVKCIDRGSRHRLQGLRMRPSISLYIHFRPHCRSLSFVHPRRKIMAAEQENGECMYANIYWTFISLGNIVFVGVIGGSGLYHLDNLTFMYVQKTIFVEFF